MVIAEPLEITGVLGKHNASLHTGTELPRLLCFSHLRWNFVYQRPQHLMTRFSTRYRVGYIEEPVIDPGLSPDDGVIDVHAVATNIEVWVPRLPPGLDATSSDERQRALLEHQLRDEPAAGRVLWYYTPMSHGFSQRLDTDFVIYDCMDELSAFRGAPPALVERERELLQRADRVFTGGRSLYESKRKLHPRTHAFPSSVDAEHFARARIASRSPEDQLQIPRPRLGFHGVIDERFDAALVREVAAARPQWHFVLIGPVVKIDPAELPRASNIHYLGPKPYAQLPSYLSGWDVAVLPFARNKSTRFISPTKTPEYLAGGVPVVSTPIVDVVAGYGDSGVVWFGGTPTEFMTAVESALAAGTDLPRFHRDADRAIRGMSWNHTFKAMQELMTCPE